MQNRPPSLSLALLGALLLSTSLHAQTQQGWTGPISGPVSIQDDSTAALTTVTRLNGVVLSSLDGKPVARVLVTSPDRRMAVITDSEGRFSFDLRRSGSQSAPQVFSSFPPSPANAPATIPINFTVRKPGYIANSIVIQLAAAPPDTPEPAIQLKIVPAATLTGHLYADSDDLPDNVSVQLRQKRIINGMADWQMTNATRVDSRGQFRFANLSPGDYKLLAPASAPNLNSRNSDDAKDSTPGKAPGFRAAFYPNADSLDAATPIHIGPSETATADLTLRAATFYKVTVPVSGLPEDRGFQVNLLAEVPGLNLAAQNSAAEGYLPDGSYDLLLVSDMAASDATKQFPIQNIASVRLQVEGKPVRTLPAAFHPAQELTVNVHLEFTNTTPPTRDPQRPETFAWVNLQPIGSAGIQPSQQNIEGSMVIRSLSPGLFHVMVSPAIGGYVASATSGTTDLLREPLRVVAGSDPRPIEVTLRDDFASLTGHIVTDPTKPADNQPIFILCLQLDRPEAQPINSIAQQNHINIPNLAPGRYLILASHNQLLFQNLEYRNDDVLRDLTSKGATITLSPGQKADIEIPLMPEDATQ